MIDDGARLLLVGGAEEAMLRQSMLSSMRHADTVHDLGGRTSLAELAAVLKQCDLFVGNDSGVSHLASSVGTPVVAVFGPTDPHAWAPYGGEAWATQDYFPNGVAVLGSGPHRALWSDLACSPCLYRRHALGTPNGCPDKTCLRRVETEQLLQVVRQRLRELSITSCVSTT
jgi:ADP-heptose:LPS heptosyltransferase